MEVFTMLLTTKVTCPYCGHENHFSAENTQGREFYTCNADEGGCDSTFVIRFSAQISTTVKRIEGEGQTGNGAHKVGDVIDFTLNDGEEVQAMAVRQEADGMVFLFVDCLADEYPMNENGGKKGGYQQSDLRWKLNAEILDRFPADLRERMIPFENKDLLRLPTEKEMFGENPYGKAEPDSVKQFEPMKDRRNRIAYQGKGGDLEWYWLQNETEGSGTGFAIVSGNGYANSTAASNSLGVRPAFKI
jgi:hypothetical protein